jgi:transposase
VFEDTATTLFGLTGVRVVEVDPERDGSVTVYVQPADAQAARCQDCSALAVRPKEWVSSRLRDLPCGDRQVRVVSVRRRWFCPTAGCPRGTFTEPLPGLPSGKRLTERLRDGLAAAVAGQGRTVAEVADTHAVSWHTVHEAFTAAVDPGLNSEPAPVAYLGIDEVRRGAPRFERDPDTGQTRQVTDRWHTGFTDLAGRQGLLGQVEGRSRQDAVDWPRQRTPHWRAAVQIVAIDMCAAFRAAAREMLPNATIIVDAFHLVQLANKMVTAVRWRIVRDKYGRRGRQGDPEYGIKRLLTRNLEDLRDDQAAKLWNTMVDDPWLADLHRAWIAKEHLRDLLALRITRAHTTPAPSVVRDRWTALLSWCAEHDHIPELVTFALRHHPRRLVR